MPSIFMLDLAYWDALYKSHRTKTELTYSDLEFGIGFYLSKAFNKAKWNSNHVFINDLVSQLNWLKTYEKSKILINNISFFLNNFNSQKNSKGWKLTSYLFGLQVAKLQIDYYKPDIIWVFDPAHLPPTLLNHISKEKKCLKIAQISAPLPKMSWFKQYDLMLSSQGVHVDSWRNHGYKAELFLPAIDSEEAVSKKWTERTLPLGFIGSITPIHSLRLDYLEAVANLYDLKCYGPGKNFISKQSNLYKSWHDPIWGKELFNTYSNTKISLNVHGDDSPTEAANVRLLESTGCGSLLLTEEKDNIRDYFDENEVITYTSKHDLLEKIEFLINNQDYSKKIAEAGMAKTLGLHTYDQRVEQMIYSLNSIL